MGMTILIIHCLAQAASWVALSGGCQASWLAQDEVSLLVGLPRMELGTKTLKAQESNVWPEGEPSELMMQDREKRPFTPVSLFFLSSGLVVRRRIIKSNQSPIL